MVNAQEIAFGIDPRRSEVVNAKRQYREALSSQKKAVPTTQLRSCRRIHFGGNLALGMCRDTVFN